MTNIPLVIALGLLSTIQVHLAKGMQRQGIEGLVEVKARLSRAASPQEKTRKPLIYLVGVALNQVVFVYALLAQPFGPPALFTSVFGVGLVALMIYSAVVLKEPLRRRDWIGSVLIILGTLVIGIENLAQSAVARGVTQTPHLFLALAFLAVTLGVLSMFALKNGSVELIAVVFGLCAGSLGSLDPFLKGVAQNIDGVSRVIPVSWLGRGILAVSFLIGFLAFLVTQWGFARRARASLLVPFYNSAYILLPLILQFVWLPDYPLSSLMVVGVCLVIGGVFLMKPPGRYGPIKPN
jgi:drug/metabolite transporter (DMT)-like permease